MRTYSGDQMAREIILADQNRRMERLLQSWDKEIQAAFDHLKTEGVRIAQEHSVRAAEDGRRAAQEAADAALTSSIASYLEGLAGQAKGNDTSAVSVPTGIRVASSLFAGPPLAEINALLSQVEKDVTTGADDSPQALAQESAAWALGHGLMPHPGDLATLLGTAGVDDAWASRFKSIGDALDGLEGKSFKNSQLKAHVAHEQFSLLKDHVNVLQSYSAERLVGLVAQPGNLGATLGAITIAPPSQSQNASRARMPDKEFNRMLDNLFGR